MFSTIKTYITIALSSVIAVLWGLFKWKSSKLEQAEKVVEYSKAEVEGLKAEKKATELVRKQVVDDIEEIGARYAEYTKEVKDIDGKPLSPQLISLLKSSGSKKRGSEAS